MPILYINHTFYDNVQLPGTFREHLRKIKQSIVFDFRKDTQHLKKEVSTSQSSVSYEKQIKQNET